MGITKKFLKSKPVCKVTFTYTAPKVNKLSLVGDFNKWDTTATPLKKSKNGTFKVVLDLDIDKSYEYRFVADGEYINDNKPEALIYNDYANSDNCLIKL